MNSIWRVHGAAILLPIQCRQIPGFDDALIASRITYQVAETQKRGDPVPIDVSPGDWSGFRQPPSLGELEAACKLVQFGKTMQVAFFHNSTTHASGVTHPEDGGDLPEKPERLAQWQARVGRAIYRSLVLGASLAGSYTRPFFEATTAANAPDTYDWAAFEFLSKFTVYDLLSSPSSDEAVFGRVGEWLIEGILSETEERAEFRDRFDRGFGRGEYCNRAGDDCPLQLSHNRKPLEISHSDAHLIVWKLSQVLWACGNIAPLVQGYDSESEEDHADKAHEEKQSRALIVSFNSFKAADVYFSSALSWTEKPTIIARAIFEPEPGTGWSKLRSPLGSCADTLRKLKHQYEDVIYNPELEEIGLPPLGAKWFETCLRYYLKLEFHPYAFKRIYSEPFKMFLDSTTIFAADDLEGRSMSKSCWLSYGSLAILDGVELLSHCDCLPPRHTLDPLLM
ncbi:hypothetical protein NLG97_g8033 [Lecanicillium saksenae]|uniref:Uncharacterized protein n=1 Tax=Lecanicillium saksenae TaxID=468837 RepID=A0ACC1QL91_9HYPO|nr:hypothetical protein NLG97_g8033 [Lecanicillium saksenae]